MQSVVLQNPIRAQRRRGRLHMPQGGQMTNVCITNDLRDIRSCTIKGEHQSNCDGFAYKWNADRERDEYTGRPCKGCLPVEARHGHLCIDCFTRWQTADAGYEAFTRALLGVDRAVQRDNGGVASSTLGYVPLSGIALTFDELESFHRKAGPTSESGAENAVRFTRAFESAVKTHPIEESSHHIARVRCPRCNRVGLIWNPTSTSRTDVEVVCSKPECTATFNQDGLEATSLRQTHNATGAVIIVNGQPLNEIIEEAAPFEPTRPEHESFDPMMLHTVKELRDMAAALHLGIPKNRSKQEFADRIRNARAAS
jgi:hypothetical protein